MLLEAEQRERALPVDARCRAGRRSGLRHKIDAECRNWSKLMDFEVRMIVDRELEPCVTEARE